MLDYWRLNHGENCGAGKQNDHVVSAKPPFILPNLLLNKNPHLLISSGKNSTKSMSATQSLTQNMPIFTTIPPDPIPIAKSTVWLQVSSAKMVKKIPAEISGIPNIPTPTPSPSGPSDLVAVDLGRGGMNQAAPPLPPLGRQLLLRYVMGICPLVICYIAIENCPFVVDLPF